MMDWISDRVGGDERGKSEGRVGIKDWMKDGDDVRMGIRFDGVRISVKCASVKRISPSAYILISGSNI